MECGITNFIRVYEKNIEGNDGLNNPILAMIPEAISLQFFLNLPVENLRNCSLVCKKWRHLIKKDVLWKDIAKKLFGQKFYNNLLCNSSVRDQVLKEIITIKALYNWAIIEALGGLQSFCEIPTLELDSNRKLEGRGDIKSEEVFAPIMRGKVVENDRTVPFLVLRYVDLSIYPKGEVKVVDYLYKNAKSNWIIREGSPSQHEKIELQHCIAEQWRFFLSLSDVKSMKQCEKVLNYLSRLKQDEPCGSIILMNEIDPKGKKIVYLA